MKRDTPKKQSDAPQQQSDGNRIWMRNIDAFDELSENKPFRLVEWRVLEAQRQQRGDRRKAARLRAQEREIERCRDALAPAV